MENKPSPSPKILVVSFLAVGAIAILCFIAYGTSYYGWQIYLELLSHFQMQFLGVSLFLLGSLLLFRHKYLILIGLFLCTLLAMQIFPWYFPPKRFAPNIGPDNTLRVFVANINIHNTRYNQVLEIVRAENPDIAVFMEVDGTWKTQLDTLSDLLPYSSGRTDAFNLGLLIYSAIPLADDQPNFFGPDNIASVATEVMVQNKPVTILATHPLPPIRPSLFHSRNHQIDLVIKALNPIQNRVILVGDLNMTMWSPYYRRLENLTNLNNTRDGFGILPTWPTVKIFPSTPAWINSFFRIPIDHCLVSDGWKVINTRLGEDTGSDHRPIVIDLMITEMS